MIFQTTISYAEIDVLVEVHYVFIPGSRGARDSLGGVRGAGPPLEPDEPATVEVVAVMSPDGTDITAELGNDVLRRLDDLAWKDYETNHTYPDPDVADPL